MLNAGRKGVLDKMNIIDIMKQAFFDNFQDAGITTEAAILFLIVAGCLGIYIFVIYRILTTRTFYSKTFNLSLILMCVLTAAIIITVQNSIIVSFGMVGALSIIRFRTAVKEPLDLVFLFWSISMGTIAGAGMLGLGIITSLIITLLLFLFYYLPEQRQSLLLMINAESNKAVPEIFEVVRKYDKHYHTQSRNVTPEGADILLEMRLKDGEALLDAISSIEGVQTVSLIAHKGESVY